MKTLNKSIIFTFFAFLIFGSASVFAQEEAQKINDIIEKKREFNKKFKNSIVFKIQLYNGDETTAVEIKENFESDYNQFKVQLTYDQPEWKTQIVGFKTRLDADRALLIIREKYPTAIVLEEKV